MMRLMVSPTSPYVRKVTVTLIELGLAERVERVPVNVWDPASPIVGVNPLGKIPALITEDGRVLVDSVVICEFLDSLPHAGPMLFPPAGAERWTALSRHAIANGALDAGISRFLELRRPAAERSPPWIERQAAKVARALDWLNEDCRSWRSPPCIGQITAGCLLGWLDFRLPADDWRRGRPALADWYEGFAARPSMRQSVPREA